MSNYSYLDGIPGAVATIVGLLPRGLSTPQNLPDLDKQQQRVVDLTDQLTRTFVKALIEAQAQAGKP